MRASEIRFAAAKVVFNNVDEINNYHAVLLDERPGECTNCGKPCGPLPSPVFLLAQSDGYGVHRIRDLLTKHAPSVAAFVARSDEGHFDMHIPDDFVGKVSSFHDFAVLMVVGRQRGKTKKCAFAVEQLRQFLLDCPQTPTKIFSTKHPAVKGAAPKAESSKQSDTTPERVKGLVEESKKRKLLPQDWEMPAEVQLPTPMTQLAFGIEHRVQAAALVARHCCEAACVFIDASKRIEIGSGLPRLQTNSVVVAAKPGKKKCRVLTHAELLMTKGYDGVNVSMIPEKAAQRLIVDTMPAALVAGLLYSFVRTESYSVE